VNEIKPVRSEDETNLKSTTRKKGERTALDRFCSNGERLFHKPEGKKEKQMKKGDRVNTGTAEKGQNTKRRDVGNDLLDSNGPAKRENNGESQRPKKTRSVGMRGRPSEEGMKVT